MTIPTESTTCTDTIPTINLWETLAEARKTHGLSQKDVANSLYLEQRIIAMIETGVFSTDVPPIFIRGYIRNYCKLLDLEWSQIQIALDAKLNQSPKPKSVFTSVPANLEIIPTPRPLFATETSFAKFSDTNLKFIGYIITGLCIFMLGFWWYIHKK